MSIDPYLQSLGPALITSTAIALVGWWVNTTVRKKSQKGSIVISHLQERQKEIHRLIQGAVDADEFSACTAKLRGLSNEIGHLSDLHDQVRKNNSKGKKIMDNLEGVFFDLKENLTTTGILVCEEERERARQTGNRLRREVLKVMFGICGAAEKIY